MGFWTPVVSQGLLQGKEGIVGQMDCGSNSKAVESPMDLVTEPLVLVSLVSHPLNWDELKQNSDKSVNIYNIKIGWTHHNSCTAINESK